MRSFYIHRPRARRVFQAVITAFVLSYVLFEVLDLDGSKLPPLPTAVERSVIASETPAEMETAHRLDRADLWNDPTVVLDRSALWMQMQSAHASRSSPLDSARAHGYRVGLPRDSITDIGLLPGLSSPV
jgi:hypothetical protein